MILIFQVGTTLLPIRVDDETRSLSFEKDGSWVSIDDVFAKSKNLDPLDLEVTKAITAQLRDLRHVEHYLKREYAIGLGAKHLKTVSDDEWSQQHPR